MRPEPWASTLSNRRNDQEIIVEFWEGTPASIELERVVTPQPNGGVVRTGPTSMHVHANANISLREETATLWPSVRRSSGAINRGDPAGDRSPNETDIAPCKRLSPKSVNLGLKCSSINIFAWQKSGQQSTQKGLRYIRVGYPHERCH